MKKLTEEQCIYAIILRIKRKGWMAIDRYFGFPKTLKGQGSWPQVHKFMFPKQKLVCSKCKCKM